MLGHLQQFPLAGLVLAYSDLKIYSHETVVLIHRCLISKSPKPCLINVWCSGPSLSCIIYLNAARGNHTAYWRPAGSGGSETLSALIPGAHGRYLQCYHVLLTPNVIGWLDGGKLLMAVGSLGSSLARRCLYTLKFLFAHSKDCTRRPRTQL